ncbi:hypothetical protein HanRHA438_Chr06g0252201 [Helianthus annuus]|nr:hypothetical protein HanRHA438_Chr06g0252201 [Helianthus annuus]
MDDGASELKPSSSSSDNTPGTVATRDSFFADRLKPDDGNGASPEASSKRLV